MLYVLKLKLLLLNFVLKKLQSLLKMQILTLLG